MWAMKKKWFFYCITLILTLIFVLLQWRDPVVIREYIERQGPWGETLQIYALLCCSQYIQCFQTGRMLQLPECLCLYLSDSFARQRKMPADFFKRMVAVEPDAEPH